MVWGSNNNRPKDTIGRILASAPPNTAIEITQTKKPRNLLTPWVSREKELKVIFHPEQSQSTNSRTLAIPSRPTIQSAPPSYNTAVGASGQTNGEGEKGGGIAQAGVISGVGMAALYCAKLALEYYYPAEVKKEEEKKGLWGN